MTMSGKKPKPELCGAMWFDKVQGNWPPRPDDRELLNRALGILHRMSTERVGWRSFFHRWYYKDEPLRHDAANLVRLARFEAMMPNGCRLVED